MDRATPDNLQLHVDDCAVTTEEMSHEEMALVESVWSHSEYDEFAEVDSICALLSTKEVSEAINV